MACGNNLYDRLSRACGSSLASSDGRRAAPLCRLTAALAREVWLPRRAVHAYLPAWAFFACDASSGWLALGAGVVECLSPLPLPLLLFSRRRCGCRALLFGFFFSALVLDWCLNSGRLGRKKRGPGHPGGWCAERASSCWRVRRYTCSATSAVD